MTVEVVAPGPSVRRFATAALMIATAMQAGDATIVNVALPHLARDLGGGMTLGAWVVTSYLCATAVVAPLTGWLSRRYGAQLVFGSAVSLFVIASLCCALAPSAAAMIAFRVVQGASGGVLHPMAQAILLDIHPKELSIAFLAVLLISVRARRGAFTLFRLDLFRDVNFTIAAFYNFMTSALLFVAVLFLPALGQGPLGYSATLAGAMIVPRAVLMMLTMLIAGRLIGKINYRILLASGWILMATGLTLLSAVPAENALPMIIVGSTVQALGAGLLLTPLSTLAFSTLAPDRRTDAAGLYSLLRQLGCACGVALMTAIF